MQVSLAGISHKTAPVAVREQFALNGDDVTRALDALKGAYEGVAVLSTCNRTEVYVASRERPVEADVVAEALLTARGASAHVPADAFYTHQGANAARHLFRVAAGLESMVMGEAEILGQVRGALGVAAAAGAASPVISRLFDWAVHAGRRARTETSIARFGTSISSTAVQLARRTLGDLRGRTVLVVGAGDAGKLAVRTLAEAGIGRMLVSSRTFDRARELALELNGAAVPFEQIVWALGQADIVISSTAATGFVIGPDLVRRACDGAAKQMLFIDVAVPRDVDPSVREAPGVHLYDIDDLRAVAEKNLKTRRGEVRKVEAIVEDEARRFNEWLRALQVTPTIAALRRRAEAIRRKELARTLGRLDLGEEDRRRIEAMSGAIVSRLLHHPITLLKQDGDGQQYVPVVRELFGLEQAADAGPDAALEP